jgi:hypothetical protein
MMRTLIANSKVVSIDALQISPSSSSRTPLIHRLPLAVSSYITTQFLYLIDITSFSLVSLSIRHLLKDHLHSTPRSVLDSIIGEQEAATLHKLVELKTNNNIMSSSLNETSNSSIIYHHYEQQQHSDGFMVIWNH